MKVYRVDFTDPDLGTLVEWHCSLAGADKRLIELQSHRDAPVGLESVTLVNVPTRKLALVGWLNRNLSTDNG